ncbi:hypothetical protein SUGI_0258180 [Cryptomeria japonica]|uniref:chorismate mutase 2 n=1 Tax=Cryptomeria japonica TaxID=3369 RepID=UPI002408CDAC|nr:chorismate mutase 2 [Cryptomeria japonica]GLJ15690.1 hypothetical protein SUGI_0258180 [Cryptomeria japonica]
MLIQRVSFLSNCSCQATFIPTANANKRHLKGNFWSPLPTYAMSLPKPKPKLPCFTPILPFPNQATATAASVFASASTEEGDRLDRSGILTLESIRDSLIRQEDSIIFNLLERSQYCFNSPAYDAKQLSFPGFNGSLVDFILKETELLHSKVGRYKSPDEHPFFPDDLVEPLLPQLDYPKVLHPAASTININKEIWRMYFDDLLPQFVGEGDDGNYGSAVVCDVSCLQALSKRIHYGKFVAEAKFRDSPNEYEPAIRAQDREALMNLLTFENVEEMVKRRVELKAMTYGREVNLHSAVVTPAYKFQPSLVAHLYSKWLMPLTKKVEVEYLLRRLD